MTLEPTTGWYWLVLLAVGAGVLVWWPPGGQEPRQPLLARARRTGAVAVLLLAALRPGFPGSDVAATTTDVDVFFVVDTTASMVAEDYDGTRPRLEGVRRDVTGVARDLPGARFSLLTFDRETVTRLPLTTDAQALATALDVLQVETSSYSQGSSITAAGPELDAALQRDQQAHPDRRRLVFYLGDGEQTSSAPATPFAVDDGLVDAGAVLGYGTARGGRMQQTGTRQSGYVLDPTTGEPALSTIDERALADVGRQLSLPYLHRTSPADGSVLTAAGVSVTPGSLSDAPVSGAGRTELYWVLLLLLAALMAWEAAATVAPLWTRRRPAGPASRRSRPAPPPIGGST